MNVRLNSFKLTASKHIDIHLAYLNGVLYIADKKSIVCIMAPDNLQASETLKIEEVKYSILAPGLPIHGILLKKKNYNLGAVAFTGTETDKDNIIIIALETPDN